MKILCPYCGQTMMATAATVQCPKCAQTLVVHQSPSLPQTPLRPLTPPTPQMPLQPPPKPVPPLMQLPSRSPSSVRSSKRGNKTTLPVLLAVGGGFALLVGGVLIAALIFYLRSSGSTVAGEEKGGSSLSSSITNLFSKALDAETTADEQVAKAYFARENNVSELRNVRWNSQPLFVAIYKAEEATSSTNQFVNSSTTDKVVDSNEDALTHLKKLNEEQRGRPARSSGRRAPPYELFRLERIGTVCFIEYEGFLLGSEKSAKERIEVKYNGYAYYSSRDEEGKSDFQFDRGQSKTVDSVGKTMRGLD